MNEENEPISTEFTAINEQVGRFWQNPKVEQVLLYHDIQSSKAHVRMLGECGIISKEESALVLGGLLQVEQELKAGKYYLEPQDIDIHSGLERHLKDLIGQSSQSLRIAKSRNDQIATDVRLWLRDAAKDIFARLVQLRETLLELSERDLEVVMPGYTHLQPACPILLAHYWLANEARFRRDNERLSQCYTQLNKLPLGACALAGTSQPIDRDLVAEYLGFDAVIENSLDAVSDRDFLIEFGGFACLVGQHLSQLAEDLLLWGTQEFGFVSLRKAFALRSLSMPHKRNPELLEVLRARPALFAGRLVEFLNQFKALPMGYSQDLQECLPGLLDVVENLKFLLELAGAILNALEINAKRMKEAADTDLSNAGTAVDFLVGRGLPSDQATRAVDALIQYCKERNKLLSNLAINEWQYFSPAFDQDIYKYVTIEESVSSRLSFGGTSQAQVSQALVRAKEQVAGDKARLKSGFRKPGSESGKQEALSR